MSRKYYYFLASLPELTFGQKPSMSVAQYLEACESQLHQEDARAVRAAVLEESGEHQGVAAQWCESRHALKNELAYERALRAGKDPAKYVRGDHSFDRVARDAAVEALNVLDPLEAQRGLDLKAWHYLDGLEGGGKFDADRAVIYGLKLAILERHEDIASARGKAVLAEYMKDERLAAVYAAVNA
jgi:hypothetical protein